VNQRLIPGDPSGPFGPGAVGISSFSLGRAVSNGCIRIPNPALRRLFAQALAGTPVVIRR
jgi:lipoprotein-anchoring transpeptidase ErfK/SrfK